MNRDSSGMALWRWFAPAVFMAQFLSLGCMPLVPLGGRPQSDLFLTREALKSKVPYGATRESTRQLLGEPFAEAPDGNSMAFFRKVTADRKILWWVLVFPAWDTEPLIYFQVQGCWFDLEGRVIQMRIWDGRESVWGGTGVPGHEDILRWLEKEAPR